MSLLPDVGFVRLKQIIGNAKSVPPLIPIIPISKSAFWAGVKSGRFPQPVKFSPRCTMWRVEDIRQLIQQLKGDLEM